MKFGTLQGKYIENILTILSKNNIEGGIETLFHYFAIFTFRFKVCDI